MSKNPVSLAPTADNEESDAPLSTGGRLTVPDLDHPAQYIEEDAIAGSYGSFSIDVDGNWSYAVSPAFAGLNAGDSVSDTFLVAAVDGTWTIVLVAISGADDAAVLSFSVFSLDGIDVLDARRGPFLADSISEIAYRSRLHGNSCTDTRTFSIA